MIYDGSRTPFDFLKCRSAFIATITCDDRPGKLFEALQHCRSTIFILRKQNTPAACRIRSSGYRRWATGVRNFLFPVTTFAAIDGIKIQQSQFPKLASALQISAFDKILDGDNAALGFGTTDTIGKNFVFYQESALYWIKATVGLPFYSKNGAIGAPAHGRHLHFANAKIAKAASALMHSNLFCTWFIAHGDCFHLSDNLAGSIPILRSALADDQLEKSGIQLMRDLKKNAEKKTIRTKYGDEISYAEFSAAASKPIIDEIDTIPAGHHGFTEDELDLSSTTTSNTGWAWAAVRTPTPKKINQIPHPSWNLSPTSGQWPINRPGWSCGSLLNLKT